MLLAHIHAELTLHLQRLRKSIRPDAAVCVSWPKKASKVPTDITEDVIRAGAEDLYVDYRFGRRCLSSSNQLSTTTILAGLRSPLSFIIRNRPSGVTS